MPQERKLALLEITRVNGQFIIEDDYESDVSFNRTPRRALKSLDRWGNVIYTGQPLEVAAAGAASGLPGRGPGVHPGGQGPAPLHAEDTPR